MNLKKFNIGLDGKPLQFTQISLNGCLFKNLKNDTLVDKRGKEK